MRVVLMTGKGGVGKTTLSAATGVRAAMTGRKTLVISTDPAHSLGDALGVRVGCEPTEVDAGLYAQQLDAHARLESSWGAVAQWLRALLDAADIEPLQAEELTVLPGADELVALLELRAQVERGVWDLVVVDCAPTAETLRLLALPEALAWYLERLLPVERRVARALRPVLGKVAGVPMPQDDVLAGADRLQRDLRAVREVLSDPATSSVRLVLTPEQVVVAESRRALTALTLHGYAVDGVVANRVVPGGGDDPWRAGWAASQEAVLAEVDDSFLPLPVWRAPYLGAEPVGVAALDALALEVYGEADPCVLREASTPLVVVEPTATGYDLLLSLPLADRDDVDLVRVGDDLAVTVAGTRRLVSLPSALRRCDVVGARLRDGSLRVSFEPDPSQWMRT